LFVSKRAHLNPTRYSPGTAPEEIDTGTLYNASGLSGSGLTIKSRSWLSGIDPLQLLLEGGGTFGTIQ
jgi:hypothetical protein